MKKLLEVIFKVLEFVILLVAFMIFIMGVITLKDMIYKVYDLPEFYSKVELFGGEEFYVSDAFYSKLMEK